MTRGQKQRRFTFLLSKLVIWAYENGYELTQGDAYRDPRLHGVVGIKKAYGHKDSFHKIRCAQDYNLFKNGRWLKTTEAHKPLGEYWESLDPLCTWGGHFNDGNHYSYGGESR